MDLMVKVFSKSKKKNRIPNSIFPLSMQNKRLTYSKLPEPNLKLSVLKLDGSSFSFHVARNATVAGVKLAIEDEFSLFPKDEREKLWSLVWSHFCLCYKGEKLIHNTTCIRKYGIKDGDQLHFVQHLRIDVVPTPQQSKNLSIESRQCSVRSTGDVEDRCTGPEYFQSGGESASPGRRSRLAHSLIELLPCSRFQHLKRNACE